MSFSIDSTSSHTAGFCSSTSGENKPDHSVVQSTKKDPASVLPDVIMMLIFSHLDLSSLEATHKVSQKWRSLAGDKLLWKKAIYREIAFGNRDWARCFGPEVVAYENRREEFDSLPWQEYIEDSQIFQKLFPKKSSKDHLMLVRLPKTLTATRNEEGELVGGLSLNSLGRLAKKFFPKNENGYSLIWDEIVNQLGDRQINKSCWVLMTKDVLEGSRKQPYRKQQEMVVDLARQFLPGYEVPGTLEAATCILSEYFLNLKRCFKDKPWTYTRCSKDIVQGYPITVGGFGSGGLHVINSSDDYDSVGVAALRKF